MHKQSSHEFATKSQIYQTYHTNSKAYQRTYFTRIMRDLNRLPKHNLEYRLINKINTLTFKDDITLINRLLVLVSITG